MRPPMGTRFEESGAGGLGLCENRINLFTGASVVSERYSAETGAIGSDIGVLRKRMSREQGKSHPSLLEERDAFSFSH